MSEYLGNPDEILKASDEQLVSAFILFLTRKKKVEEVSRRYQRVRRRKESIEARINDMTEILERKFRAGNGRVLFTELLPEAADRYDTTLSFMSLLSMIKNQGYDAEQKENFGEITVVRKDPEILAAQRDAEAAGVIEYADDEFDDDFEAFGGEAGRIMDDWDIGTEDNGEA